MKSWVSIVALIAGAVFAFAAEPREVWEQAVKAKGGRERLRRVHAIAVYLKPAQVNMSGPPGTLLCVFPDRYFEFDGRGSGQYPFIDSNAAVGFADSPRAIVVNGATDQVGMDANGTPRVAWRLSALERDRLTLNQIVFLLESAWLEPHPLEVKRNVLTVVADGRSYQISLNGARLPERVVALPLPGQKSKRQYDYRLERYREVQGIPMPTRLTWISGMRQWTWDADYEVDPSFNPKLFERMPDLASGPEPWRQR